ncbi:threonine aldolase 1 isoform X2 [Polyodon spathula]|uniref:threonine aldolase 1 isoform X2 n=1 Tax=Polyodon spathula TaxID=7913 RepID=UPI001B7D91F5|nr:threonine aldolase 1 isoform X2 [Polyodon spathula]
MTLKRLTCSLRALLQRRCQITNISSTGLEQPHCISSVYKAGVLIARSYYGAARSTDQADDGSVPVRTVDLRSDTVTKPGPAMRRAMAKAEVGDDVYGEDPTVNVMSHCRERGEEIILGEKSHLHIYEQGGSAQCAGVHSCTVRNNPDGTFNLEEVESKIRHGYPDSHYPRTRLIGVENTHNIQGGRVLPLAFLKELRGLADRYDLAVHMDGARLMNAAVALSVHPSEILQHCDSVSVCLSKGLGAPVGCLLGGPREFVQRAVRARKVLGGGMRQAGILAAAGILALNNMVGRLKDDHRNAKTFARALLQADSPLCCVDLSTVETNILRFRVQQPGLTPQEFCTRMEAVTPGEVESLGQGVRVLMFPHVEGSVRAVWHLDVSEEDTELAIRKLNYITHKYREERQSA